MFAEVEKAIGEHNKVHNPSGVPFKGEKKRTDAEQHSEAEGAVSLEVLGSTAEQLQPEWKLPGPESQEMICTFMVLLMVWSVPGNLWLSFGVVTFVVPLTRKTLPSSASICCLGR